MYSYLFAQACVEVNDLRKVYIFENIAVVVRKVNKQGIFLIIGIFRLLKKKYIIHNRQIIKVKNKQKLDRVALLQKLNICQNI